MGLQAFMTVLFIVFGGGFRSLVNFYSVAQWGFYFLTVGELLFSRESEELTVLVMHRSLVW